MEEVTAYHESGHAFVALALGAIVHSLSIDPDWDDGPERYGDIEIEWPAGKYDRVPHLEDKILVALGGPVSEMIYTGDPFHPAVVPEWRVDWENAWRVAAEIPIPKNKRMDYLVTKSRWLYAVLSRDINWDTIAVIADHLLAHENLEREQLEDFISDWPGASGLFRPTP